MLFNSIDFVFFFPVVTLIYFLLPHRFRWLHLLAASCIFYMYFVPVYILVLFLTIGIDYAAGILIENTQDHRHRKWWLVMSIVTNLGLLCIFKYYNFFIDNVDWVLHAAGINIHIPFLNVLLPLGLSFHTFQAMGYTIEVYRGNQKAERHLGIYALYVMFFPQLVAGPIERPQNLLHQFHERHSPQYGNITSGLRLMLWGMIKKVVIADRIALVTDPIFNHPHSYSAIALYTGVALFHIQVFCDFSGYSDIAIGAARIMGIRLMTNFNMPFHARTVPEFWRRWHISLSSWFRDYIYLPLGGSKRGTLRTYINLFIIFELSGLWHGASWLFIMWGVVQATYMIVGHMTKNMRQRINHALGITRIGWLDHSLDIIITFSLTAFARIFFRGNSIEDAWYFISKLKDIPAELVKIAATHKVGFLHMPSFREALLPCLLAVAGMELAHLLKNKYDLDNTISKRPVIFRWSLYFSGLILLTFFGVYDSHQFIYFQF